jgi:hypothetical protein
MRAKKDALRTGKIEFYKHRKFHVNLDQYFDSDMLKKDSVIVLNEK